jgi:hypothetical protein
MFVDTHTDGGSGYLQYSGGKSSGNSAPVDEVCGLDIHYDIPMTNIFPLGSERISGSEIHSDDEEHL